LKKATSIAFNPPSYSVAIPSSGNTSVTVTAFVKDQNGDVMSGAGFTPTYAISPSYSGVSVNSSTGIVTVLSSAAVGNATVTASCGSLTPAGATLTLTTAPPVPTTIVFNPPSYSANIPISGSTPVTVTAQVKDQFGNVMYGITPTYSIAPSYSGVSVDSSTGTVTVLSSAAGGNVTLKASYSSLPQASATLSLKKPTTIVFNPPSYSANIPASSSTTTTVTAQVKDQNGAVMIGCAPTYSMNNVNRISAQ
jgi:hypothetical protein